MSVSIVIRFPDELAARLAERKTRTFEPTSNFVRRAVEHALDPEDGLDATDALERALADEEARNEALFHGERKS
jgi:predicted DNA-binding protein